MSRFRPIRLIGVTLGASLILAVGVYGPATLLGPLPAATATLVTPPAAAANASPPQLPAAGASAVTAFSAPAGQSGSPTSSTEPIAVSGTAEALPMASAAKIVTALVVLDAKPLAPGETGPGLPITAADFAGYLDYEATGARTVLVFPDENWTERELLQAMILGSSNNHADTLARWAFGSIDAYVEAANVWLAKQGLTGTRMADATGLDEASVGTATDLARLAGLAAAHPLVAELLASPASALADRRGVENTTAFLPELGITGISRSYTDAAGVCFLFTGQVDVGDEAFTFAGAFIGEPDYDTLTADLTALMESARAGVGELPVLAEGDAYVEFDTAWGSAAEGVVRVSKTRIGWQATVPRDTVVTLEDFSTGRSGRIVGRVAADAGGQELSAPLVLDQAIDAPGLGWRLLNPVPVITALLDSRG